MSATDPPTQPQPISQPNQPPRQQHGDDDTSQLGAFQVSTASQSAFITVELIVYLIACLGIFITAAIVDEDGGAGFTASQAWFYVTLLTVGYLVSRGLARFNGRNNSRVL